MKPVAEMTPVELLSEFCRKHEYHEAVAEARAWMATPEAANYDFSRDVRGVGRVLLWKRTGQPVSEVREPRPEQDRRWKDLCAEINRRFTQARPFTGPYR